MDKDNKYYNLVENLVKQNRRFIGNEQFLDEIVDDVLCHANTIIQTINDENVINEFLNKTVTTSIITVAKKMNKTIKHTSDAQQLIDRINSQKQNQTINKKYVDDFINGNIENIQNNQISENTTEPEAKQITYEQLSEITDNNDIDIEFNDEEINIDKTTISNKDSDACNTDNGAIADDSKQVSLLNESFKPFENCETDEVTDYNSDADNIQIDTIANNFNKQFDEINNQDYADDTENINENLPELENLPEQKDDNFELSFDNSNDLENSADENNILDENYKIENLNNTDEYNEIDESIEIENDSDDSSLSLEEFNSDNDFVVDSLPIETTDYNLDETEDVINEDSILNETNNEICHSIYDILSYEQNPITEHPNNIDIERIVEDIKALNTEYPELNILDIYRLRYKEFKEIDNISDILSMDYNNVIHALNLIMDVV